MSNNMIEIESRVGPYRITKDDLRWLGELAEALSARHVHLRFPPTTPAEWQSVVMDALQGVFAVEALPPRPLSPAELLNHQLAEILMSPEEYQDDDGWFNPEALRQAVKKLKDAAGE